MRINNNENITVIAREGKIQVEKYRYLGTMLTEKWKNEVKIKTRIFSILRGK